MNNQVRHKPDIREGEGLAVASEAFRVGLKTELISEIGDAAVPELDQMLHSRDTGGYVVDDNGMNELVGMLIIDEHYRDFQLAEQRNVQCPDA